MATFIPNVTDVFPEPALFTPDFAFMDKMLARRQAMYDQGWSQVNAAYGFVNRKLTNPTNLKERDVFLKQAKDNLKGLSAMDLSQRQNVNAANNVFLPWANNEKALGDAALTAHWDKEEQIGDGYRLQDGGKLYNEFNVNYIRKQRNAFANDAADTWGDYYKNKRSYIPYHNYTEEINKLMKDFKPSTYEIDKLSGLYKITDKNASWTQAEIRKFLDANLSEASKRQMRIEGDVLYNNDPKALSQVYMNNAQLEINQFDDGIALANKLLASETNKDKIEDLKGYVSKMKDKRKSLLDNVETIKKGDYTMIKKNGENLAFDIHYNQVLGKMAKGWSHEDITYKIDADKVALEIYSQNRQDARQAKALAHAEKMAYLKGEIAPPPQQNTIQTEDTKSVSPEIIKQKVGELNTQSVQLTDLNKGMVLTWMKELDPAKNKNLTIADVTETDISNFKKQGLNGKPLQASHPFYSNENKIRENDLAAGIEEKRLRTVEQKVKEGYTEEDKRTLNELESKLANLPKTIKLDDGTTVTSKELGDAIRSGKLKVEANNIFGADWLSSGNDYMVTINGKSYRAVDKIEGRGEQRVSKNPDLLSLAQALKAVEKNDVYSRYQSDVNAYFKKHGAELANTANLLTFSKGSYEAKTLEAEMHNVFPEAQYTIQHAGIGTDAVNQGSSYFYITPKSGTTASSDNIKAYLQQRGYTDVEAIEQTGSGTVLYQIKNHKSSVVAQYSQFNPLEKLVIQDLSTVGNSTGAYESAPYQSYSNRYLQIMRSNNQYYLKVQGLNGDDTFGMFPQPFSDPASAVLKGQQLTASVGSVSEALLQQYMKLANQ